MEFLKKLLLIVLLTSTYLLPAQNTEEIQKAFKESYAFEAQGKYSDAVKAVKKVYKADSYPVNLRLGWLTYMAGQFTESVSYYSKSIKLKPLSIEARLGMTYPASAMGNWDNVITQYKEILKIDANHYTANLKLGQIYYSRKDYSSAEKYFNVVLNFYPFTYDPVINAAWNYLKMGKMREAKVLFDYALMLSPGDTSALAGLEQIK